MVVSFRNITTDSETTPTRGDIDRISRKFQSVPREGTVIVIFQDLFTATPIDAGADYEYEIAIRRQIEKMCPSDDELRASVKHYPAPPEWYDDDDNAF